MSMNTITKVTISIILSAFTLLLAFLEGQSSVKSNTIVQIFDSTHSYGPYFGLCVKVDPVGLPRIACATTIK